MYLVYLFQFSTAIDIAGEGEEREASPVETAETSEDTADEIPNHSPPRRAKSPADSEPQPVGDVAESTPKAKPTAVTSFKEFLNSRRTSKLSDKISQEQINRQVSNIARVQYNDICGEINNRRCNLTILVCCSLFFILLSLCQCIAKIHINSKRAFHNRARLSSGSFFPTNKSERKAENHAEF